MTIPFDQIEAIFFDLDGTLVDTDDKAVERWERHLRPFFRHRAHNLARWLMMKVETPGNMLITLLDWLHLDRPLMGFTDKLRRRRGVYPADEFRLIPGVAEALLTLAPHYQLGLITTRSRYHIDQFLLRFPEIAPLFQVTCGLQDTRYLKPSPQPVLFAAEKLNLAPEKCVMVGDTTVDVLSARRAGAWAVGVLCGFGEREELDRCGAQLLLDSTAEMKQVISYPSPPDQ
jgi:phosphoglycolate phosphatase-like HAD superfamily hydrolase